MNMLSIQIGNRSYSKKNNITINDLNHMEGHQDILKVNKDNKVN
jgi:hypothetical protein